MVGGDARHRASVDAALPEHSPQWWIDLPALTASPDQNRLKDDGLYHPIVVGGRMIVSSQLKDCVTAYDLVDGKLLWRYFTQGPVR